MDFHSIFLSIGKILFHFGFWGLSCILIFGCVGLFFLIVFLSYELGKDKPFYFIIALFFIALLIGAIFIYMGSENPSNEMNKILSFEFPKPDFIIHNNGIYKT